MACNLGDIDAIYSIHLLYGLWSTVSANWPLLFRISTFPTMVTLTLTLMALSLTLMSLSIVANDSIHSSSFNWIDHIYPMTYTSSLFFLQNQRTNLVDRRKWPSQQDLTSHISIAIIQSHKKAKYMLFLLSFHLRLLNTTSTSIKRLIIGTFIPKSLEFSEIRTHQKWSLWKTRNFFLKLQSWKISLRKPISKINLRIPSSVDVHHTCTNFFVERIDQPW